MADSPLAAVPDRVRPRAPSRVRWLGLGLVLGVAGTLVLQGMDAPAPTRPQDHISPLRDFVVERIADDGSERVESTLVVSPTGDPESWKLVNDCLTHQFRPWTSERWSRRQMTYRVRQDNDVGRARVEFTVIGGGFVEVDVPQGRRERLRGPYGAFEPLARLPFPPVEPPREGDGRGGL